MEKLMDYLHFHVPCKCLKTDTNEQFQLIETNRTGVIFENGITFDWQTVENVIKPILRPLQTITPDEENELHNVGCFSISGEYPASYKREVLYNHRAKEIKYLLGKGFDVFGLIDQKFAVSSVSKID